MKRIIRNISYLLLVFSLLPILSGCNNEDDVVEIFTGKTWKLSRLTDKDSSDRFYQGLWNGDKTAQNKSLSLLNNEENTFTLSFEGSEINGELMGTTVSGRGVNSSFSGTWSADGKSNSMTINIKSSGSESDVLAKAFIAGLQKVYKYEGDANSLTLFFDDNGITRVMGFKPQ